MKQFIRKAFGFKQKVICLAVLCLTFCCVKANAQTSSVKNNEKPQQSAQGILAPAIDSLAVKKPSMNQSSPSTSSMLPRLIQIQLGRWIFVGKDMNGTQFFVDKQINRVSKDLLKVWTRRIYSDLSFTVALNQWDCNNRRLRVSQETRYNQQQQVTNYNGQITVWADVVPDSIGEEMLSAVCNRVAKNKLDGEDTNTVPSALPPNFTMIEITAVKANLRDNPEAKASVIRVVKRGEILLSSDGEQSGAWYKVSDPQNSNKELWVHRAACRVVSGKESANKMQ